jgi:hypothetical protein
MGSLWKWSSVVFALFLTAATVLSCGGKPGQGGQVTGASVTLAQRSSGGAEQVSGPTTSIDVGQFPKNPPTVTRPEYFRASDGLSKEGFTLFVLGDNSAPDPSQLGLYQMNVTKMGDGQTFVTVAIKNASNIAKSLLYVKYDAKQYNPHEVQPGQFYGPQRDRIFFSVFSVEGVVPIAVLRLLPDVKGYLTGSGVVCQVIFEHKPYDSKLKRIQSVADGSYNQVVSPTFIDNHDGSVTLRWREVDLGDYNNDGEVGIADLGPMAMYYGALTTSGSYQDIAKMIDGNASGEVDIGDLQPIAANYGNIVSGYRVYRGHDASPAPIFDPSPLPNHQNPSLPLTIARPTTVPPTNYPDYEYTDGAAYDPSSPPTTPIFYKITPFSIPDNAEGVSSARIVNGNVYSGDGTPPQWDSSSAIGITNAVGGNARIKVWFGSATDADSPPVHYRLYYHVAPFNKATATKIDIGPITDGNYTYVLGDHGEIITNGVLYYLLVTAIDSATFPNETTNSSTPSAAATMLNPQDIDPPTWDTTTGATSIVEGNGKVKVNFGTATDALSPPVTFNVYYSAGSTINWQTPAVIKGFPYGPAVITGLTNGTTYSVAVRAQDSAPVPNVDANTVVLTGTPDVGKPTDLEPPVWDTTVGITSARPGDGSVRVSFGTASDAASPPVTYNIYYSQGATLDFATATRIASVAQSSYIVQPLTNGQAYTFAVRAQDSATPPNEDGNLKTIAATPNVGLDNMPPQPFAGIQTVNPDDKTVTVTWNPATDYLSQSPPVKYNVYWEVDTGSGPLDYASAIAAGRTALHQTGAQYAVTGLTNGTKYRFSVRAEDSATPPNEDENTASLTATPNPPPPFVTQVIDSTPMRTGMYSSLSASSGGTVGVSYLALDQGELRYTSSSNGYATYDVVDGGGATPVGKYTSLFIDALDVPYVSYVDFTHEGDPTPYTDVKYANKQGGTWTKEVAVGGAPNHILTWTSMKIDPTDGTTPCIAYIDTKSTQLKFVRKTGGTWGTPEVVAPSGDDGAANCSLAFLPVGSDYWPIVAYRDAGTKALMLASRDPSTGAWSSEVADNSSSDTGLYVSLGFDATAGHNVGISYYDRTNLALMFSYRVAPAWYPFVVKTPVSVGYTSLDFDNNPPVTFPAIAYYDWGGKAVVFTIYNGNLHKFGEFNTIESGFTTGGFCSLGFDTNYKANIAYYANGQLKLAKSP